MTVVFDLRSGVSGDMLLSAMLDMYSREKSIREVIETVVKAASVISPTAVDVLEINRLSKRAIGLSTRWEPMPQDHLSAQEMKRYMEEALAIISANDRVRRMSKRMLDHLLEAEKVAHDCRDMDEVHLHEAGTPDTLVDMIGISLLFDLLELDGEWIKATPISLGSGTVNTSHGEMDVPVPAVRAMIRNIPVRSGPVEGELATPTGVAAVSSFVEIWMDHSELGDQGVIDGTLVGTGAGTREYASFPNILSIWEVR